MSHSVAVYGPQNSRDLSKSVRRRPYASDGAMTSPICGQLAPPTAVGMGQLATMLATTPLAFLLGDRDRAAHAFRGGVETIVCDARREDPVRAERMIIALRQAWNAL